MIFRKSAFPLSFTVEELTAFVEGLVKEKDWREFKVGEISLSYKPFYFFNFTSFTELKDEESGMMTVSGSESGKMVFDAESGELNEELSYLIEENSPTSSVKPPQGYPCETIPPAFSIQEVKKIAGLKLAEKLSLPKDNVEVSGVRLVFVPVWIAFITVSQGTFKIEVNAVDGSLMREEQVPFREKGFLELTGETLQELKQPGKWLEYSKGIAGSVYHSSLLHSIGKAIMQNYWLQIAIIIFLIVLIILAVF